MTTMLPSEQRQEQRTSDDSLVHIACCHDEYLSICGEDLGEEWEKGRVDPGETCVVCFALAAAEDAAGDDCTCPCCVDLPIGYEVA